MPSVRALFLGSDVRSLSQIQQVDIIAPGEKVEEVLVETASSSHDDDYIDFSNGWLLTVVASVIFVVVLAANLYVIIMLGLGRE